MITMLLCCVCVVYRHITRPQLQVDRTRVITSDSVSPASPFCTLLLFLPPCPILPLLSPPLALSSSPPPPLPIPFPSHSTPLLPLPPPLTLLFSSPLTWLFSPPTSTSYTSPPPLPSLSTSISHLLLSCLCVSPTRSPLHSCPGSPHKEQSQPEGCKTTTLRRTQKTLSSEPMAL